MRTDLTPEQIDEWRWQQALGVRDGGLVPPERWHSVANEYRRLVRENVLPPPEPDQDTLDARAVLGAYHNGQTADWYDGDPSFIRAKAALAEIKARVRREAIMALPDVPTEQLEAAADKAMNSRDCGFPRPDGVDWLAAIKQVYGQ